MNNEIKIDKDLDNKGIKSKDKIFFIYTRISEEGQYDKSLEDQYLILKSIADKENLVTTQYEEIQSGFRGGERKYFNEMISILEADSGNSTTKRKYGGIFFYNISRLSRNDEDFSRIEILLNKGYIFRSATERIENNPTGRLLFRMLSAFAIFESKKLSSRMVISRIFSIIDKNYRALGGKLTFGYYYSGKKEKFPNVNEREKEVINKIYDYRASQKFTLEEIKNKIIDEYEDVFLKYIQDKIKQAKKKDKEEYKKKVIKKKKSIDFDKEIDDKDDKEKEIIDFQNDSKEKIIGKMIENIIYNTGVLKYNGDTIREINILDDHIKDIIQKNIKDDLKNKGIEIIGDNEINSKIKIKYYNSKLKIIEDIKYQKVRDSIRKKKKGKKTIGLFTDLIYLIIGKKEYKANTSKGSKGYIEYKKDFIIDDKKTSRGRSEKEIEKRLINSKLFQKIYKIENMKDLQIKKDKTTLYDYIDKKTDFLIKDRLKRLIQDNTQLKAQIGNLEEKISIEKMIGLIEYYQQEIKDIQDKIKKNQDVIYGLEQEKTNIILGFFSLFNKSFFSKEKEIRGIIYHIIIERIVINLDNQEDIKINVYFRKFINDILGIKDKIDI